MGSLSFLLHTSYVIYPRMRPDPDTFSKWRKNCDVNCSCPGETVREMQDQLLEEIISQWARTICLERIPAISLYLRGSVSYCAYVSCVKEQPPIGQDLSKLAVGCLALSHDGLHLPPSAPSPSHTLLASSSSHHFRSALPILPVCLPGSIKDPCVGLVTSYPALKELQDQPFTDDSVLVHQLC